MKDKIKIFIDEIFSKPPKKNYPTNKIVYNTSMKYGQLISLT